MAGSKSMIVRIGAVLNLVVFAVAMIMIPLVFDL